MKPKLQVALDFSRIDDALICAEKAITSGADILEIGNYLIKNAGFQGIRTFCKRFPNIPVVADIKTISGKSPEIKAAAESGAIGVTISGAISTQNWDICLQRAETCKVDVLLDFRELSPTIIRHQWNLIKDADYVVIDLAQESSMTILEEIAFYFEIPFIIENFAHLDHWQNLLPMGVSAAMIRYMESTTPATQETTAPDAQEIAREIHESMNVLLPDISPHKYSEQRLHERLSHLTPALICESCDEEITLLENVHPLHRYTKIVARATTIKIWRGCHRAIPEFLLEVPAHNIVVIDATGEKDAVWNYLTTTIAIKHNLAGAVIYGAITDVNLIQNTGFPCYVAALNPMPIRGPVTSPPLVNIPLQIGHSSISPGDWLMGDDSGIICISERKIFHVVAQSLILACNREDVRQQLENTHNSDTIRKLIRQYYAN